MKRGRYQTAPKPLPFLKIILSAAIVAILLFVFLILQHRPFNSIADAPIPETKLENQTAIPGFEELTLSANTKKQTVVLFNPPENTCLFRISLILEDGTILWTSKEIKPGGDSDPITLTQPLSEGLYFNTVLKYECFAMDANKTPLNGAEIKLTLRVK